MKTKLFLLVCFVAVSLVYWLGLYRGQRVAHNYRDFKAGWIQGYQTRNAQTWPGRSKDLRDLDGISLPQLKQIGWSNYVNNHWSPDAWK